MESPDRSPPRWHNGPAGMVVRIALVLASIGFLWLAQGRLSEYREAYASSFAFDRGLWMSYVALLVLGGLAFGIALVLPARLSGYRWVRALVVGIVPLLILVAALVAQSREGFLALPGWVTFEIAFGTVVPHVAGAMLGVAVAVGLAER